jgi:hypothetical protein
MVKRGVSLRATRFYQSVEVSAEVNLPTELTIEAVRATGMICWTMAKEMAQEAMAEAENFLPTEEGGDHGLF